jgi:hypothetical protein
MPQSIGRLFPATLLSILVTAIGFGCSPGELGDGSAGVHERYAAGLKHKLGLIPPEAEAEKMREADDASRIF